MSEAFERERQNNDSLAALQSKVSQLRHVTVDIYDQARDQGVLDSTSETFSTMTTSLKGSARRLGTMASQGNKVAILKLAGMVVGSTSDFDRKTNIKQGAIATRCFDTTIYDIPNPNLMASSHPSQSSANLKSPGSKRRAKSPPTTQPD
ncbi:hypothetical protein KC340_g16548 [Hortaea werneckii]|nr:hypothetical protein KC365_g349 [Hortaea werneckii]KAI7293187.1 hypothetical protein KC340_g16548 [Hortaea werneckii]KAI7399011.1 hypothetical protein KC328_g4201 [Hortaea werneckii]